MKRILCYGDSNTWGTIADGSKKHCLLKDAYPQILQGLLGDEYQVISEGMPSRTTNLDDIKFPKGNRNGALFFPQCVISHDPLDYIIIFLGTNDLKSKFNRSTIQIAQAIKNDYIDYVRQNLKGELTKVPQFILIAPSIVDERNFEGFEGATEKSKNFNKVFKEMAQENDCLFISNKGLKSGKDGVHLTRSSHKLLAEKLASLIL